MRQRFVVVLSKKEKNHGTRAEGRGAQLIGQPQI